MKTYSRTPDPRDAEVIANATGYVVCGFRGRGQYARESFTKLDEAKAAGKVMAQGLGRPVLLYAVMESTTCATRQAHIENVEP